MATSSDGGYSWAGPLIQGLSGYFGSGSAGNAQVAGENAGIGTENNLGSTVRGIYSPQVTTGNQAFGTLGQQLGLNGQPANYAAFENSPGYQFSVQQGTQAINREAAAAGNLYTPNTLTNVGSYVTGAASQNYNNYVNQLLQTAGYGASGNANLGSNLTSIGDNVAQMQVGIGNANAASAAGQARGVGTAASGLPWGQIVSGIGSMFNGGGGAGSNANDSGFTGGGGSTDLSNYFSNSNLFGAGNPLDSNYSSLNPDGSFDTSNLGNLDYSLTGGSGDSGF